jgi:hypothetical protein
MCVYFSFTANGGQPSNEMLHDALVHLIENVRSDAGENVTVRKILPKWMLYRLDVLLEAFLCPICFPNKLGSLDSLSEISRALGARVDS